MSYQPPPGHGASLCIKGAFVTAHLASAVKEASFRQEMIEYIIKNANWESASVFDLVDWMARGVAGRKVPQSRHLSFFKLEFGLFATMSRRHLVRSSLDHRCQRCLQDHESVDHIFQCSAALETNLTHWQTTKQQFTQSRTCKEMLKALELGLLSWLVNGDPVEWPDPIPQQQDKIGILIHDAFIEQCQIGWNQLIRGRVSTLWQKTQHVYEQTRFNTTDHSSHSWSAKLIFSMWNFGIQCWIDRNNSLYGTSEAEKLSKKHETLDATICHIFQHDIGHVYPCDSHLFARPLEERLKHSLEQKFWWVESVQIATRRWNTLNNPNEAQSPAGTPRHSFMHNNTDQPKNLHATPPINEGRRPRVRLKTTASHSVSNFSHIPT
jgi:hypothetical protein